jgi:molybdenum cofactor cytidylyltransferase
MDKVWAIILAAGASTRMKRQKMLLPFRDKTIVETVIENMTRAVNESYVVVLGSHREEIIKKIGNPELNFCVNENYKDGMLTSVICGIRSLPEDAAAVLVVLGDQPQISGDVAKLVIKKWKENKKEIVIPTFKGKRGHPALFGNKYFREIEKLDHEQGLRAILRMFKHDVLEVECDFSEILRDIDTPEEYRLETGKI